MLREQISIEMRNGLPDEAHPEIALVNASGNRRAVWKWAGQKHERFDRLYAALLQLEEQRQGLTPTYTGKYRPEGLE